MPNFNRVVSYSRAIFKVLRSISQEAQAGVLPSRIKAKYNSAASRSIASRAASTSNRYPEGLEYFRNSDRPSFQSI